MKIAKNINQKLKHVDIENRVYMYDATIILDFLNRTFMPLPYFVKKESLPLIGASVDPRMEHMKEPGKYLDQFISVGKMYEFYLMFRQQMDYTTPVETRWRFGLIMKKLLYSKNGWQFCIKRVGRAQIWNAGPVMLRVQASVEDRESFAVAKTNVLAGQVESSPDDLLDQEDQHEDLIDAIAYSNQAPKIGIDQGQPGGDRTVEVLVETKEDDTVELKELNFVEVKPGDFEGLEFEVDVKVEPLPLSEDPTLM